MSSNFDEFQRQLAREQQAQFAGSIHRATRKLALEALRRVVLKTPVDTGRARGNWQTTIDRPATGTQETTDPSGGQTISEGSNVIGQAPIFRPIVLTNNLPYIERLEDGSSQQAPNGMLSVTVAELESQFREIDDADLL